MGDAFNLRTVFWLLFFSAILASTNSRNAAPSNPEASSWNRINRASTYS